MAKWPIHLRDEAQLVVANTAKLPELFRGKPPIDRNGYGRHRVC